MKISTPQLFRQATQTMTQAAQKLAQTQTQLGTGKRVINASDDPTGASALLRLDGLVRRQQGNLANLNTLRDRLGGREVALQSTSDTLLRVRDLAIQAGSDTLTADQRKHIGVEVRALRDQLVGLANSRDAGGQPLFAGAGSSAQPYGRDAQGQVSYTGDQTATDAPTGDNQSLTLDSGGSTIFRSAQRDGTPVPFFTALDDLSAALDRNDGAAIRRGGTEVDALRAPVTLAIADTGFQRSAVEDRTTQAEEQLVQLQSVVSEHRDVDYAEAASRMQQQVMALQAAQASLARIGQLSLFNQLR